MNLRRLVIASLSCLALFGQGKVSPEDRLRFAEGITKRYQATGADKEFGYCTVSGAENKTLVHVMPDIPRETVMSLLAHKSLHTFLLDKGFTKIEFRHGPEKCILGATVTATSFILYGETKEIALKE